MSRQFIAEYLAELNRLMRVSGASRETVVREAFKDLLKRYARQKDLVFLAEYPLVTSRKKNIAVDGAIVHSLRVPLGYWEAKDADDDLDEEIEKKFRAGYPQDNIIFEDTRTAVLIQNKNEVLRCAVDDEARMLELMDLFFGYERPEIGEFRKAVAQFAADLPAITSALNEQIEKAGATLPAYQTAEARFLGHAKSTINPAITTADIREMLMQHILTEEIFAHVFSESDFHRKNTVARELYALEETFFTGGVKRDTLRALESYYTAIKQNAAQITSHNEKQKFLKVIYENFYKVYNPKAADRLGVVYTPNEIVKFMIDGADWLCQQHFGKALIDPGVEILDPATGTGTFVCELLEKFRGAHPAKLHHKYREEIHANEVAILPYYVANLNIEATYFAIAQQYAEYPNLCFVDTLDNVAGLGKFSGFQEDLFGAVSEGNVARIKRQNKRKISVIIGNPPYNANQQNENDNNKNRDYPVIDARIKATYIKESTAQKTKAYDMYTRFFRWASDRIDKEGIVAFVTNRSFIDARTMDGFRKIASRDFSEVHIVDLGGDVRGNTKLSGTKHNVFGIQTGVAISFLIRRKNANGKCRIFYNRRPEMETAEEKLSHLADAHLSALKMDEITPDAKANWLGLTANDFESLIPIASKDTKAAYSSGQERAVFRSYSLGIVTNRDDWAYDESEASLSKKLSFFIKSYETERLRWKSTHVKKTNISNFVTRDIKWTSELEACLEKDTELAFDRKRLTRSLYRPFVRRFTYFAPHITHRAYQNFSFFPDSASQNIVLSFGVEERAAFAILATPHVANRDMFMPSAAQCVPRYRYTSTGERLDNITDWAVEQFRAHYGAKATITKDDIFHYVYAVLHDPLYREKYALNLKREFPRIPFYAGFAQWAAWGATLMALHIGFETVEPWPLQRVDAADERSRAAGLSPKPILRADPEAGLITLDSETQLAGIPLNAFAYRLGNRCALDWILDQHKEKTPKDPTIREKFNTYRFADHKEKVVDLIARVTRVSVETVAITDAMRNAKR